MAKKAGFTVTVEKDRSAEVMRKLEGNVKDAMDQMGLKCRNLILFQLQQGFGKPIRITGDLQRSIDYEVDGNVLTVGAKADFIGKTSGDKDMSYAIYVHEGTSKMAGRPYIRNALYSTTQMEKVLTAGAAALKKGFDT